MKVKLISIVAIILAGVIVALTVITSAVSKTNEYNGYIKVARANADNQVPYIACMNYEKAFEIKCEDEGVYKEYLKQCEILGSNFYDKAVKNYTVKFPMSVNAYETICDYYYNAGNFKEIISLTLEANEKGIANERIKNWYYECFYMINRVMVGLEEANSFLGNVALVKKDGLYGYASSEGSYALAPTYKKASQMLNGVAAVNDGKEWFLINSAGYKIARPTEKMDYLSFPNNNLVPIGKNNKYTFTNTGLAIPKEFKYDYVSNFKNELAAVKKDGKWALVNSEGKNITDFDYEDVLLDEYGTCISNGVIFVKESGKYYMVDAKGKKISDQGFDNAYSFVSDQPAAVCVDGKWGFIDVEGKMVIEPKYDKAKSFSIGLAPVCVKGTWKYINTSEENLIKETFSDAKPFAANGIAAIKQNDVWSYIKLLGYEQ